VSGRVQGVFFRQTAARLAVTSGLAGWVRNLSDGRVEAVFEGDETKVSTMVDWCRQGPDFARVARCEVSWEPPVGERGFAIL
jgi:acylphosphatase